MSSSLAYVWHPCRPQKATHSLLKEGRAPLFISRTVRWSRKVLSPAHSPHGFSLPAIAGSGRGFRSALARDSSTPGLRSAGLFWGHPCGPSGLKFLPRSSESPVVVISVPGSLKDQAVPPHPRNSRGTPYSRPSPIPTCHLPQTPLHTLEGYLQQSREAWLTTPIHSLPVWVKAALLPFFR